MPKSCRTQLLRSTLVLGAMLGASATSPQEANTSLSPAALAEIATVALGAHVSVISLTDIFDDSACGGIPPILVVAPHAVHADQGGNHPPELE